MNIHPVGDVASLHRATKLADPARPLNKPKAEPASTHITQPAELRRVESPADRADPTVREQPTAADEKVRGVIRLLESGHFKGVADVRLRINFFDELSQRAAAAAAPVIEEESQNLVAGMSAKVEELVGALAADEETAAAVGELVEAFDAAVQAAVDDATAGPSIDRAGLAESVEAAFNVLVEQMTALFTPDATSSDVSNTHGTASAIPEAAGRVTSAAGAIEQPTIEPAAAEPATGIVAALTAVPERGNDLPLNQLDNPTAVPRVEPVGDVEQPDAGPTLTLDDAIASLTEAFREALATLMDSIETATALPDPSPPSGHGVAYNKFLAIYNELRGLAPTVDERA